MKNIEAPGILTMALYANKGVKFMRSNIAIESEIDLINHAVASIVIENTELPTWKREIDYSDNYLEQYTDTFKFEFHGISSEIKDVLKLLRGRREGWIVEIITVDNQSFVFQSPVFVSKKYEKAENVRGWVVEMTYREPTKLDYLTKLNNLLMTNSYIYLGDNKILGDGTGTPIVANK